MIIPPGGTKPLVRRAAIRMMACMKKLVDILVAVVVAAVLGAVPCLSGCGGGDEADDSVAGLIKRLGSDNVDTQLRAAWTLTKMKAEAVGPLTEAMRGKDRTLARRAADVLGAIGEPAVDSLTAALADSAFRWPHVAAAALAQIGPPSRAAVDTLLATLKDGDAEARAMAAETLGSLKLEINAVMPALLNALRDGDDNVCKAAAESLWNFGEGSVDAMVDALSDSRVKRPKHLAIVLARFGPAAGKAASALVALLKKGDVDVRAAAVFALSKIDPDPVVVVGPLIGALSDAGDNISQMAAGVLGRLGAPAVDALIEAMEDKNIRARAALALSMIGPPACKSADRLLVMLKTGDEEARGLAAFALSKVGGGQAKVISALTDVLQNDPSGYSVQMYAAEALGRIAPPARAAIPALTEALKHSHEAVRQAASEALEDIKSPTTKPHIAPCGHSHH